MKATTAIMWVFVLFVMAERFVRLSLPKLGWF